MVTGLSIVACSWAVLHSALVSSLAVGLIGAWWYIFLYSYPKVMLILIHPQANESELYYYLL